MATLVPFHEKIGTLKIPDLLFKQLVDVTEKFDRSSWVQHEVFTKDEASILSSYLIQMLDEEYLVRAIFPTSWWINNSASVLALKNSRKADIAEYINDAIRRHHYLGYEQHTNRVTTKDIEFKPLTETTKKILIETAAFVKMSEGFYVHWSPT